MIEYDEADIHTQNAAMLYFRKATILREATHLTADMHSDLTWGYHCFRVIHIKSCHIPNSKPIT